MPSGLNESIKWSMLELRGLVEDEDVRVYYQRAQRHLGLYPFHLNDLNTAIREILSSTINCYDNELQGLVLVYKNPKLLTALGAILHDSHFIHVDVLADFYIFKPEIGCTLKGIINKKAENHVGVLVHKAFNVSIPKPEESEEWLGDCIYVGQEVKFTVTHLDFKGKLPFIRGILLADGIDVANSDNPVLSSTNGVEVDKKLGQWQEAGITENVPETAKKHSKKYSTVVDSSIDALSDTDNKLEVFRRKEEKNRRHKRGASANSRINDESSTDGTEEHVSNSVSTEDRHASSDKRNRKNGRASSQNNTDIDEKSTVNPWKKRRDSSLRETVDIDEKPEISPRKKRRHSSLSETVDVDEKPEISHRKKRRDMSLSDTIDIDKIPKISSRKKRGDLSLSDTIDIDEKPKISSRKASEERPINGETSAMGEETVLKTESRNRKNKISTASVEESCERKTGMIQVPSKSEIFKTGLQNEKTVGNDEDRGGRVVSPKKHSKKNKTLDSETEEASEFETKPCVRVKKKKKKTSKVENDENAVEEPESLPPNGRDYEFVKPDINSCVSSSVKCKRKRRRDVDDNDEEASEPSQPESVNSEQNDSEFFQDIRIKVEPDPSDIEDAVLERSNAKRKKKRAKTELEPGDESFETTRIKTEPDASDLEDARPSKKKSKKKRSSDGDSSSGIRIKVEPNASDVEGSAIPKSRLKPEPHSFNIKVDRDNDSV